MDAKNQGKQYITMEDLAKRWGLSYSTVRTKVCRKTIGIPVHQFPFGPRFDLAEVTSFEKKVPTIKQGETNGTK